MAIPDRLPKPTWGPKKHRAWAGQLTDVEDGRQVLSTDGSIQISEIAQGRDLSVAPWVRGGTQRRLYRVCGQDGPELVYINVTPQGEPEEAP